MQRLPNIKLSIIKEDENELESEKQVNQDVENHAESIEEKPVKKGRGKRGKDKKPRVKKPPTEKQLAHLTKIRELSRQKREAKKLEKIRIKKEIDQKAEYNTSKKREVVIPKTKPIAIKPKKNKDHDYKQFINLMDRYEEYKEERRSDINFLNNY